MKDTGKVLERAWVAVLAMLLASCASEPLTEMPTAEVPGSPALIRALPMIAVAAVQLPDYWLLVDAPVVERPATGGRNLQFGCVALNFGIDADGRTFDIQVRKSYPQGRFAEHAVSLIKAWQFEPVAGNPMHQPVRTDKLLTLQAVDGDVRLVDAEHVAKFCR